jgi:hypothetical protein
MIKQGVNIMEALIGSLICLGGGALLLLVLFMVMYNTLIAKRTRWITP